MSDSSTGKQLKLSKWKKIRYTMVICAVVALLLYFPSEIAFRIYHGVPVQLFSRSISEDTRSLAEDDTTGMDFDSLHYYEIFQKSENPILFYEPKPGFSKGAVQINSHGFRDREVTLEKPAGTIRIVILGDSIIWGHGIVLEDTLAKQLEALLNERLEGNYEVLNFGVSGYSLQQEVEQFLVRADPFDPDIAILGLCINDSLYSSAEGDFFAAKEGGLFAKSYLFENLVLKWNYVLHHKLGVPRRYLEHIVDVRGQLTRLQAASPDLPWLVLMFPQLQDVDNYQGHQEHLKLTQPARDLGFTVRDLLGDFRKHSSQTLGIDHIHPNRLGNQIAAEAVFDELMQNEMLPAEAKLATEDQE